MTLVHGVPEGGTVWEVPSARNAHARKARFFGEYVVINGFLTNYLTDLTFEVFLLPSACRGS